MPEGIVERIERALGAPGIAAMLAERLPPTDLRSLLLEVARRRAAATAPADVLHRYSTDRFVRPASIDPARLERLAHHVLAELPAGYERIELSPVCPFGTSAALGGVSQDWVVTTIRGSEVVSDPTSVLALECALRRRRERTTPVRICTVQRVVRAQPVDASFSQHFALLALCAAGRVGDEEELLAEHVEALRRALATLDVGDVSIDQKPRKPAYYDGPTFGISIGATEVVEGGFVDWTQRLLGDRKERLLTTGLGLDLLAQIAARAGEMS